MLRILLLLVVISLSSLVAQADTVTGGLFVFQGRFASLTEVLQFSGTTFSVNGAASTQFGISLPAMFACFPCASGTSVSLSSSAFLEPFDFNFGTVTVNGIPHSLLTAASDMSFSAGSVIVPITSDPFIQLTTPFSLTQGSLHGPGYGVGFTGGGTANLSLSFFGTDALGNSQYRFNSLGYSFSGPGPEPVPEPASFLLLMTGVLALPVIWRKRKLK